MAGPDVPNPHPHKKTKVLSLLVHAAAKVGKSTLSSTAPKPILVLDAEGSWRFIKVKKRHWDPMTEPIPRYDGTWEACIVTVTQWEQVLQILRHLTQVEHDFKSVVIDSITEIQRRLKANLKGTEAMQIQDWGQLLTQMDAVIRAYRDLTLLPGAVECVVMIAETREDKGKWKPYMQGQIGISLPYLVDICGYLYVDSIADADGQMTKKMRRLFIGTHPSFESGERVQGTLGDVVDDPVISEMIEKIFANIELTDTEQEPTTA